VVTKTRDVNEKAKERFVTGPQDSRKVSRIFFNAGQETGGSATAWVETELAVARLALDLILDEGFRGDRHPKIECVHDPSVVAPTTPLAAGLLSAAR
jgi:hypothetical protein